MYSSQKNFFAKTFTSWHLFPFRTCESKPHKRLRKAVLVNVSAGGARRRLQGLFYESHRIDETIRTVLVELAIFGVDSLGEKEIVHPLYTVEQLRNASCVDGCCAPGRLFLRNQLFLRTQLFLRPTPPEKLLCSSRTSPHPNIQLLLQRSSYFRLRRSLLLPPETTL